ncbi:Gfo/Idh/MocA family protein [Anaerocolumna aminovalerica]|jgi:UDP-N-acetylglucosamine 3-dehydrogenase|uniref:Gfo/Idh/MocA family protein n=1 Tax=Anaerocolumna aminovalerica TaxID=1527 RepID=UPI001C0EDF31|nr:Gfo/Idh/MocA family oxidoreductase [Anaerocolumna aminovalerica]MBU5332624.1 Gfo/Idh/MocA family oxidoreductase [Anaerocolumna aminovalerica]
MIRVGIIGCGGIAHAHAECYKHIHEAEVVAVADVIKERADKMADYLGALALYNGDEIFNRKDIDMVDICIPTSMHCEYAVKAAQAGLHILCEKPIALTVEEGKKMRDAAEKAGVKLMIAHVLRYFPEYETAKMITENGDIGRPVMVRTYRGGVHPGRIREWYEDINLSGGAIHDMTIHDIDFLMHCFGDVKEVYAKGNAYKHERYNEYDVVMLEFKNGVIAHIEGDWSKPAGSPFTTKLEIVGTEGIYQSNSEDSIPIICQIENTESGASDGVAIPESPLTARTNPYAKEIIDFINAIENNTDTPISCNDAIKAAYISLCAMESMKTGKKIYPKEVV